MAGGHGSPTRLVRPPRSQAERAADDLLHDLVRAAVDAGDARVGEGARDRVLEHVAVAAVQLHAAVDDAALQLGRHHFAIAASSGVSSPALSASTQRSTKAVAELDLGLHLGQREARVLEGADRLPEGLALA